MFDDGIGFGFGLRDFDLVRFWLFGLFFVVLDVVVIIIYKLNKVF